MKLDILAIGSHPDDIELSCGGTVALNIDRGKKCGILDLTAGELGTRGNPERRRKEAAESAGIFGLSVRKNLGMPDGFFTVSKDNIISIAREIRRYRPEIVLANAVHDRHPDHGRAARLAEEACYYAGLRKIEIWDEEEVSLEAWRPKVVYHYIQSNYIEPDFIIDVTSVWEKKISAIKAFKSQFFDPDSREPETYISKPGFLEFLESRCKMWGHAIGVEYGEGFTANRKIGVKDLFDLI